MDGALIEDQRAWQLKARKFAQEELRPASLRLDRMSDPRATFDWEIVSKASKLGFRTAVVPREYGGHGIDLVTQALVINELAKGDSPMAKTLSQCWKWSHMIAAACTDDQKERFLKPFMADDTYLLAQAGTEPNAGSDGRFPPPEDLKAGWKLRAERKGDEWTLNGDKCFMANGGVAKLYFISARTDPTISLKQGATIFAVPVDTPGFRVGKIFNKSGWRFYQNAEIIFEDCRVPHANVVGGVNGGYTLRTTGPQRHFGDFELGANALGVCDAAVEMAVQHTRTRWQDAQYFSDNQTVQLMLSEMHMLTEALRSFVMRVATEGDSRTGQYANNAVLLQNFATDVIQRVTALNMDIHAGAGVTMMAAGAEKLARDAVIWTHLAGDSVQRMRAVVKR